MSSEIEKLREALRNLEVAANTAIHCFEKRPENFVLSMKMLYDRAEEERMALNSTQEVGRG